MIDAKVTPTTRLLNHDSNGITERMISKISNIGNPNGRNLVRLNCWTGNVGKVMERNPYYDSERGGEVGIARQMEREKVFGKTETVICLPWKWVEA